MADDLHELLGELAGPVALHGLASKVDVVRRLQDMVRTDYADMFVGREEQARAAVPAVVEDLWSRRLADEAGWSPPTGHDRLQAAYAELGEVGVLCGLNAGPTASAAEAAMGADRVPGSVPGLADYPWAQWGWVCFTDRDVDWLAQEPASLALLFGAWAPGPVLGDDLAAEWAVEDAEGRSELAGEASERLGALLVDTLRAQGLTCSWEGEARYRVELTDLSWRKPLPR